MEPVASLLPSALRELLRRGEMSQGKLEFAWKAAVGSAIDRATSIHLAENGMLEVRVEDPAWRRELRRTQPMILGRLRELLGAATINRVKIVGGAKGRS